MPSRFLALWGAAPWRFRRHSKAGIVSGFLPLDPPVNSFANCGQKLPGFCALVQPARTFAIKKGFRLPRQCLICFWLITCPATTTDFLLESMHNPRHGNMQSSLANINHGIFHHFPIFSTTASLLQQYRGFANIPCLAV